MRVVSSPHARDRRGFTLIELLVVISIISLLVALLLPALRAARESARTMQCLSNERMIMTGVHYYANEYQGYMPYGVRQWTTDWGQLVSGYMVHGEMTWTATATVNPIFLDPSASVQKGKLHYSANPMAMPDVNPNNANLLARRTPKLDDLKRPTEFAPIVDGTQQDTTGNVASTAYAIQGVWSRYNPATATTPIQAGPNTDLNTTLGYIRWRHGGEEAANLAFLDGHAATMRIGSVEQRHVRAEKFPWEP